MAGSLGCRRVSLVRPVLLAVFGALAWLLWLAGPSQAASVLPTIPAVPAVPSAPTIPLSSSLLPSPLPDPIGPVAHGLLSAIPSPTQVSALPGTVVSQLPGSTATPLVTALTDPASSLVDTVVGTIPALPGLPSVPQLPPGPALPPTLPPLPGVLDPPGRGLPIGAVPGVPLRARAESEHALAYPTLLPIPGRGAATSMRIPGFILADLVVLPRQCWRRRKCLSFRAALRPANRSLRWHRPKSLARRRNRKAARPPTARRTSLNNVHWRHRSTAAPSPTVGKSPQPNLRSIRGQLPTEQVNPVPVAGTTIRAKQRGTKSQSGERQCKSKPVATTQSGPRRHQPPGS
ncbi:hypothetical protein AHiyo8_42370 [Arthrobacter sp. Hiyo8]|nr:hypothetical protein AHiyo8_42370 [Arthrobacter sp. Hiyo8]